MKLSANTPLFLVVDDDEGVTTTGLIGLIDMAVGHAVKTKPGDRRAWIDSVAIFTDEGEAQAATDLARRKRFLQTSFQDAEILGAGGFALLDSEGAIMVREVFFD